MSQVQEAPAAHPFALAKRRGRAALVHQLGDHDQGHGRIEGFFCGAGRPAEGPGIPPPSAVDIAAMRQIAARYNTEFVGPPLGAS